MFALWAKASAQEQVIEVAVDEVMSTDTDPRVIALPGS